MRWKFFVCFFLGAALCLAIMAPIFSDDKDGFPQQIDALNDQIQIGNLLTGLYLTDAQVAEIIPLSRRAGALRENVRNLRDSMVKKHGAKYVSLLTTMREEIFKTGDASEESKKAFFNVESQVRDKKKEMNEELQSLNKQVQAILTDNQKVIVAEYQPCVVPVQSITHPERIGASPDNSGVIKHLEDIREISGEDWPEKKAAILAKLTVKLKNKLMKDEVPSMLEKIGAVMEEARAMSADEFELEKEKLAARVVPAHEKESFDSALKWKIDKFLLHKSFAEVAEMKSGYDRTAARGRQKDKPAYQKKIRPVSSPEP
ncbi:MAG: hypothetical protein RDV48_20220 [Candidatus Eremiobacteraeota bacterium]|nr:hypothetical protein [Candidatus Eremiobacteraeota bacterium]